MFPRANVVEKTLAILQMVRMDKEENIIFRRQNMGTNYYLITGKKIKEQTRSGLEYKVPEEIHIGKNSHGWMFHLCAYPERNLVCLNDWMGAFQKKGSQIRDECGDVLTPEEMETIIKKDVSGSSEVKSWLAMYPPGTSMSKYGNGCVQDECGLIRIGGLPRGTDGNYVMDTRIGFS